MHYTADVQSLEACEHDNVRLYVSRYCCLHAVGL